MKDENHKEVMWDEDSNVCSVHEEDLEVTDQMAEEAEEEKEPSVEKSVAKSDTDSINADEILEARKQQLEAQDAKRAKL